MNLRDNKRRLAGAAMSAVAALVLAACGGSAADGEDAAATDGPIKIGVVLDITGVGAAIGGPGKEAIDLIAKQVTEINGQPVEWIIEDDASTEDGAAKAIDKLVNQDQVSIVLGASRTGPSLAMRPVAEAASTPMISFSTNVAIVDGSEWVFKTAQSDITVVEKLVEHAKNNGWKTVGLLRDASAFGEGIFDMINTVGADYGVKAVIEEKFATDATDFTAQVLNLKKAKADANIIWGIPPAAGLAQKAYVQQGLKAPVMQSHGIGNPVFLETAGDAANGIFAPLGRIIVPDQLDAADPQKAVIDQFVADFSAEYGKNPSSFAGYARDGAQMAIDAITAVGADKTAIRDYLQQLSGWVGVSGVYTMSATDHSGLTKDAMVILTVDQGAWKLVK